MISNGQLTSVLVPYQLPEFIRDNPDYSNFVLFIQAYYEWLEETGNVTDRTKNLLNYKDVDSTTNEFINYFYNDFLQYFPKNILANKTEVLKLAKQMYQAKGTPAAFQFLFRTLYNSDVDFFETKEVVFKASAGTWYVAKSLKLATLDQNFLKTSNLRIFGESTLSIATIENVVESQNKMEVFISNIERLFQSGEIARVVDGNNQTVYFLSSKNKHISAYSNILNYSTGDLVVFNNVTYVAKQNTIAHDPTNTVYWSIYGQQAEVLRAKIVGQISQVKISSNANFRGQNYQGANTVLGYPGDPIVIYGGLNSDTGHGASATISTVTKGSIKAIRVANTVVPGTANTLTLVGGFGYSLEDSAQNAFSVINIVGGGGAIANITGVNAASVVYVGNSFYNPITTVSNISIDRAYRFFSQPLGVTANNTNYSWDSTTLYPAFANVTSNATTTLANAFSFISPFSAYPISAVTILNQGGGLTQPPTVTAASLYKTRDDINNIAYADLASLGILGPISINNPGLGYSVNDKVNIIGGSGFGAYANITSVAANGAIQNVSYVYSTTNLYPTPLGGMGYRLNALPTINVSNSLITGANVANLSIAGIVGQGAKFFSETDRVGSITTINITDYGEDYIAPPNVSFKVQDIIVTNIALGNVPSRGDALYQGTSITNALYKATVDSIVSLQNDIDPLKDIYKLRVYNYNSKPNIALPLLANNKTYSLTITKAYENNLINLPYYGLLNYANGTITYGDGTAKGTVSFLNGLTIGQGEYLDTKGQPSSFDVLQSVDYNNYTYQITLEKEIEKYRSALLNLLHPTGMKVRGRYAMKSNGSMQTHVVDALQTGYLLYDSVGANAAFVLMSNFNNYEDLFSDLDVTEDLLNSSDPLVDLLVDQISASNFAVPSTNIIQFGNLNTGTNLANILFSNSTIAFTTANGRQFKSEVNTINYLTNTLTTKDNVWLSFANVASVIGTAGQNYINISSVYTSSYNIVNNGNYTTANNPLADIIDIGDYILVNNMIFVVNTLNTTNNIITSITLDKNLTYNATGNLTVNHVLSATAQYVRIFGPLGQQYVPYLTTEVGDTIITQDGRAILIN